MRDNRRPSDRLRLGRVAAASVIATMVLLTSLPAGGAPAVRGVGDEGTAVRGHPVQEGRGSVQPEAKQYTLSPHYYYYFQVYAHGSGVSLRFAVAASAALDALVMDQSQFSAFTASGSRTAVYTTSGASIDASAALPSSGRYYLVIDNDLSQTTVSFTVTYSTVPVDVYHLYSGPPAPIGLADYGIQNTTGTLLPYSLTAKSATGTAVINGVSAYNGSAPTGSSPYGASLQLNVMLQVNTTSASYVYWLQNVLSLYTNNNTAYFLNNIWNMSAPDAPLKPSIIQGGGKVYPSQRSNYYAVSSVLFHYALPLSAQLPIAVSSSGNKVTATFSYQQSSGGRVTGGGVYDAATITEPARVVAAAIVVSGYSLNPGGTFYDAELVFGGQCCSAITSFNAMDSTLSMSYTLTNGDVVSPNSVYGFGSDTAEAAFNLRTSQAQNGFSVGLGSPDFSKSFVVVPLPQVRLTLSYALPGGGSMPTAPVLKYVSGGTALSAQLGTSSATFTADAGSSWSVTGTAPVSAVERWSTTDVTGGTASADLAEVVNYYHQFLVNASYSAVGPGRLQAPSLRGTSFGAQLVAAIGGQGAYWLDDGSSWSVPATVGGSSAAERWEAGGSTSGTVSSGTTVRPVYFEQFLVTLGFQVVGGGTPGGLVANSTSVGVEGSLVIFESGATLWADAGTDVTLANATSGSTPSERWHSNSTLSMAVASPVALNPTYYHQYLVTVQEAYQGSAAALFQGGWFDSGSSVGLSCSASEGWRFSGWTGTGQGSYTGDSQTAPVLVDGPLTETAILDPGIEIRAVGGGTVAYQVGASAGEVGSGGSTVEYAPVGTTVTLTAMPSTLQSLTGWTGAVNGAQGVVVMELRSPASVAANFGLNYGEVGAILVGVVAALAVAAGLLKMRSRGRVMLPPPPPPGASTA